MPLRYRVFADRRQAGRVLAGLLWSYRNRTDVVVLGLPRGGLPVGCEVATALHAPLRVLVVRKLGVPGHEEYAMGAIASGGHAVIDTGVVRMLRISAAQIREVTERERCELARREAAYGNATSAEIDGKTVILVDDGIATGASMYVALRTVGDGRPARTVVAVPVAPVSVRHRLAKHADEIVIASTPPRFAAVGDAYDDFHQVSDDEVREMMSRIAG